MKRFSPIFKLILFWLVFFIMQHVLFVLVNVKSLHSTWSETFNSLFTALPMDLATSCYLVTLPLLFVIAGGFGLSDAIIYRLNKIITIVFIVICSILLCSDISLFQVWGTKINAKALGYLKYPKELGPTVFASENMILFGLIGLQIAGGIWLLKRFQKASKTEKINNWVQAGYSIVILGLLVVGFRGGIQRVPINRNWVFMSNDPLLNYGAMNSFWNTADLLTHPLDKGENPYQFFEIGKAAQLTNTLHEMQGDSTVAVFNTIRPNVVIVFLESWAADVIACLDGEKNVTPGICKLANEGILFDQFYSTGYRTEQGFLATLSSTPALPVGSVIQTFGKFDKLPNLYRVLKKDGYHTSFYSGGRLFFDNIEAYLRSAGVDVMKGENEWTINKRTVWGAYDEELFAMHLKELNQMSSPFFSAITTMTTHEWFDADVPQLFFGDADHVNDRYRNTMHYADSCLYHYLSEAKLQPWYNNTIFILVADHACKFPKGRNNYEKLRHHIPMLITGGALKPEWRGKRISTIASHTDIASTLLAQLKLSHHDFPYSKNLFGSHPVPFAYYAFDNGFGLVTPKGDLLYDHNRKMFTETTFQDSSEMDRYGNLGKAYLQVQFENNMNLLGIKK